MKVIKVICENNAQPHIQRRPMSFCACGKSRDLLKVREMSYYSRSQHLYCACTETVIYELPV